MQSPRSSKPTYSLKPIAFLMCRVHADYVTGIEAAVSGFPSMVADSMRDVMEIENLLLDFTLDRTRIDEWLRADAKTARTKFSPASVRARIHKGGLGRKGPDGSEDLDYRAHSQALHVNPRRLPFGGRGPSDDQGFAADAPWWDMYEHGRRIVLAIERVRSELAVAEWETVPAPENLEAFGEGWVRTQQMQDIFIALLKASVAEAKNKPDSTET